MKHQDDEEMRCWFRPLFIEGPVPEWKEKKEYRSLDGPHYVAFPICQICGFVIWNWPHFEETMPKAICDECAVDVDQ